MILNSFRLICLLLISQYAFSQDSIYPPPSARIIPKLDTVNGEIRQDNYFWLRDKFNPEVLNYLYAENGFTQAVTKKTTLLQKKIYEEMLSHIEENDQSVPYKKNNYWYYSRQEKGKEYAISCRKKDSLNAAEEIILDRNKVAEGLGYVNIGAAVSPSDNYLLYSIDFKGNRVRTIFFKDLITGENLPENIPNCISYIWANDNKTIFYTLAEPKTLRAFKVLKHQLGTPVSQDQEVFTEPDKTFQISFNKSSSEKYIFFVSDQTLSNEVWYLDAAKPEEKPRLFCARRPNIKYSLNHYRGQFYIHTNWNANDYKLMVCNEVHTATENWKDVIPGRKNVMLESVIFIKDFMILKEQENTIQKIRIINLTTKEEKILDFNEPVYSLSIQENSDTIYDKLRYSYVSMTTPSSLYEYDFASGTSKLLKKEIVKNYDPSAYEMKRIYAPASDGKLIPISMVYKKGLILSGKNPVLMQGYGAYGNGGNPGFNSNYLSLLNRGFVIVNAHIRGGNDLGQAWYEDGKLLHKKNTFTDFINCAEFLIKEKYTSPEYLVIQGGSAGGLLMGAVVNMRPDLFKAVIATVPFVDVVNTMLDETIPLTTFEFDEWGNPKKKEYYDYINSYSPYDNVKAQNYPVMLVTAGYDDSQVGYWEPAKWVAKLRATKTDTNLLAFKTEMSGGHGGASGFYSYYRDQAFIDAFIMNALGIKESYLVLKGKVSDNSGPLPFVNVYIKGTTTATTTNSEGEYELQIKNTDKDILFQCMGYKTIAKRVDIKSRISEFDVKMQSEAYELKTVVVNASAKDPAYVIIKEAVDKRKFYLNAVKNYSCDVYIKGADRLKHIPKKLPAFLPKSELPDSSNLGLLSLSESRSKYYWRAPDDVKEEMTASKVAGFNQGFSWNRASDFKFNFYENTVSFPEFSDRPFISPISQAAFFYYKYQFMGSFQEGGRTINKIKLIPKRKSDPVFNGYVYIVENTWQLHSLELVLDKNSNIEFVDTLNINLQYVPVKDDIWMPLSLKLEGLESIFGFRATQVSVGFFTNYELNVPFKKGFFNNEIFRVEKSANKKDTVYWNTSRPVLLADDEAANYRKAARMDSLRDTKHYKDSLNHKYNKFNPLFAVLDGYYYYDRNTNFGFSTRAIINSLQYNTVEGVNLNMDFTISKYDTKTYKNMRLEPVLRYGFSNHHLNPSIRFSSNLNQLKFEAIEIAGGKGVSQVNDKNPIHPILNSVYTLVAGDNYMKLYEKEFFKTAYRREIVNGLLVRSQLEYAHRHMLENSTLYSFRRNTDLNFTSNQPFPNIINDDNALILGVSLKVRFSQKYSLRPNLKIIESTKFPAFLISYRKGLNGLGSKLNYDFAEIGLSHEIDLKLFGETMFNAFVGGFFNHQKLSFIDYKHFNGNQTIYYNRNSDYSFSDNVREPERAFQLLNYYNFSTDDSYIEAHIMHDFKSFIVNKFPLLRKTKFKNRAGINYLQTKTLGEHIELDLGVYGILKVFSVDFVSTYNKYSHYKPLLRFGINIEL